MSITIYFKCLASFTVSLSHNYYYNVFLHIQWNPDFLNLKEKQKLVRKIREFEKSGVKLQSLTKEGKLIMGRVKGGSIN